MYGNNTPLSPSLESLSRSSSNFYTLDDVGDRHYPSPYTPGNHRGGDIHQGAGPATPHSRRLNGPETVNLSTKVDQMMTIMSSTQQLLVSQQAATVRLEETVAKLTQDVTDLKSTAVATGEDASGVGAKKPNKKTKIPKEQIVSA